MPSIKPLFALTIFVIGLTAALGGCAPMQFAQTYPLPGEDVFPEGIAFDEATGDFFVGSTTDGTSEVTSRSWGRRPRCFSSPVATGARPPPA